MCGRDEVLAARTRVDGVFFDDRLLSAVVGVTAATRTHPGIELGASPRAGIMLARASRALALVRGRDHVIDQDLVDLGPPVLAHRLRLKDVRTDADSARAGDRDGRARAPRRVAGPACRSRRGASSSPPSRSSRSRSAHHRADLAALFWGSTFLLASAYAAIGCLLVRRRLARCMASGPGVPGGDAARLRHGSRAPPPRPPVSADLPRAFLPGIEVRVVLAPAWHDRTLGPVAAALAPGVNRLRLPFTAARRGAYALRQATLEAADVLGLARVRLPVPLDERITVPPASVPRRTGAREPGEGGASAEHVRRRRRSDELLETRRYVPGDDVRRLNWKLLAHAGELFVRLGEDSPPPRAHLLAVLDTTECPALPAGLSDAALDGLVEDCASALAALLRQGCAVAVSLAGAPRCETWTAERLPALRALLADAWWAPAGSPFPLPNDRSVRAVVFALAGSLSLDRILADLRSRRWRTTLVLRDPPAPPVRPRATVRALLFRG